ncbi:MAG: heavy metal-associated domain-containing protein [Bdellovibrionales bacterium]|nr:heavy metal-associated domain-containing protein [Bdellovibrionales bacterium]
MYEVKVSGMTCGSCANSISHVLKSIDPKVKVEVDLQEQIVRVETEKSEKEITALIEEAGFPVSGSRQINN